jgi:hypothetical protein
MLKNVLTWTLTIALLLPIYGYADSTTVPEFQSIGECQDWVRDYAAKVDTGSHYDIDMKDWLYSFAVYGPSSETSCDDGQCTWWVPGNENGPTGGGCGMIEDTGEHFFADAWVLARRNLVDMISIYESKLRLLPEYRYGNECHYPEGGDPYSNCGVMMNDANQPCATLNPINQRLHIPCLNVSGTLYWKEADLLEPWTFKMSNSGPGFDVPGHTDDCATYTASNIIHIPCVKLGDKSYWADFEVLDTVPVELRLKDYGAN